MEKIININFQGRVIPIEESAYNTLKQYTDGLRRHFASEESSEEIINDIENRIAELLTARLKQGASCINNNDLNAVIDSIGRIEDIRAAEGEEEPKTASGNAAQADAQATTSRFYRNADDKVIAGVCSGIANRMGVDPVIVRILFVLLFGALFWVYVVLWLIVPAHSTTSHITRRLFRNPDEKVIAGVCSGLAVYFKMESWKIRLVFLLPLIISIAFQSMDVFTWHWGFAPGFFVGSFGSTFFMLYVILWIAIPYASTSTDKMEMRGEKIDINSIKAATQARTSGTTQATRAARRAGSGLGRIIGILFKAFFLFIAGCIALGLFAALIGLLFAGTALMPLANFMLEGWNQYAVAWTGVALALGIPMLAFIVWLVRRLMGVRTQRHYLGYVFAGLWVIGVVCAIYMAALITRNFTAKSAIEEEVVMAQPSTGKLYVNTSAAPGAWHSTQHRTWLNNWEIEDEDFHLISRDSLWLDNVKVNIEQSPDSLFHIYKTRTSHGHSSMAANQYASHVVFDMVQQDSIVSMPPGFVISSKDKFRDQRVVVTIEVPLGKTVEVSKEIDERNWFNVHRRHRRRHHEHYWNEDYNRNQPRQYMMTASGLTDLADTVTETSTGNTNDTMED